MVLGALGQRDRARAMLQEISKALEDKLVGDECMSPYLCTSYL